MAGIDNRGMFLLSPRPGVCQTCARDHRPDEPHDVTLYYAMRFKLERGRDPTWKDAVAHCSPRVRAAWERELRKVGRWTEPSSQLPECAPMPEAVLERKPKRRGKRK